ncbi:MAG: hypothetical protein JKX99_09405 [Robiginitomaculum sp.]|nr:hypothetical protein [Robiginitomaculum sp.]
MRPTQPEFMLNPNGKEMQGAIKLLEQVRHDLTMAPIAPVWSLEQTSAAIAAIDLSKPVGTLAALNETSRLMQNGDLLSAGSKCFGYFNPTAAGPAIFGDLLAAARNPQLAVLSHAPASVLIERRVIAFMCTQAGLAPGAGGHFTSGGSEANATSLQLALNQAHPSFDQQGVAAFSGRPLLYVSADSHLAWIKIARSAGLGTDAVQLVPALKGQMDTTALAARIIADRKAGDCPVMIAATMGTTNAGEIDPLLACAKLAGEHEIHFHVDAAWAGALIIDPSRRALVRGIEQADSITIDAHKWLSVPMGAGMILIKEPTKASASFGVATGYMPAGDGQDPYITTTQWSRRFIGIRLWMMLRAVGVTGYQKMFDRHFALAEALREKLPQAGWKIQNYSALPVILFTDDQFKLDSQQIADQLEARGRVWLGRVDYGGVSCLRACLTSYLTELADIDVLLAELDEVRQGLA